MCAHVPVSSAESQGSLVTLRCCSPYSDGFTRERGLQALAKWLSLRQHVSDLDMRKIWKGLFYAFWHSDKAPVQVLFILLFCL
jgi:hypothetical protein